MPYLNWKNSGPSIAMTSHPSYQTQLHLGLTAQLAVELSSELLRVFGTGGEELKLDLPEGWTLFWKQRAGSGRMQLAHPQTNQWVATLNLARDHGLAVARALADLPANSASVVVSPLGTLAPIVNFELVLGVQR